jgi:hypothetical protein
MSPTHRHFPLITCSNDQRSLLALIDVRPKRICCSPGDDRRHLIAS